MDPNRGTDAPKSSRRNGRVVLSLLVILLLGVGLTLALKYRSNAISTFLWPERSSNLELSFQITTDRSDRPLEPQNGIYVPFDPVISINGQTNCFCQIEIYLEDQLIGRTATYDWTRRTSSGVTVIQNWFHFDSIPLKPGLNRVTAKAKQIGGETGSTETVESAQTIKWEPQEFLRPIIYDVPDKVATSSVRVKGVGFPSAQVRVVLLDNVEWGQPQNEVAPAVIASADENGHFETDLQFPDHPGRYVVFASPASAKDRGPYVHQEPVVTFAPNSSSRAVLTINYEKIIVDIESTKPKDDPAIADLLVGHTTLPQFVSHEFDLRIGDSQIAFDFREAVPQISTNQGLITVRAQGVVDRASYFPVRNGRLSITRGYRHSYPVQGENDSIAVVVSDYTARAYVPAPRTIQSQTVVWDDSVDRLDRNQGIQVNLAFNPTKSPRELLRFLTLSPYQLFSYRFASIFSLLIAFLYAIPILWLLSLLATEPPLSWVDESYLGRLKRVSRTMLILVLLPGLQRVAGSFADLFFDRVFSLSSELGLPAWLRTTSSNHPLLLLLSFLLVWISVLIFLSALIIFVRRRKSARVLLRELRLGIVYAGIIQFGLILVFVAILLLNSQVGASLIPTTIIAAVFLGVIVVSIRNLWRREIVSEPLPLKYLLLTFVFVVLLAYPANLNIYSITRVQFSTYEVTYSNLAYFLGIVQDFVPYVVLFGILQILRSVTPRTGIHEFLLTIPLLIFACYVIGPTTNWFIIPIPFLLAVKLYPRLLASPQKRVETLNYLTPVTIERRKSFIRRILDQSFAERLLASIDQMEKKIVSGDLKASEFMKRREDLESYAATMREQNIVFCELNSRESVEAKDLALCLGPHQTSWENGIHALKRGLIISLPFLLLYLLTFLIRQIRLENPFVFLWTSLRIITFVLDWAIYAFFFGYFFNQLSGESGLKKGLKVALVVVACFSPMWLMSGISSVELSATFLRAGQIFLFFTVLGVWAFDYYTFRNSLKDQFSWKKFAQFGDMPSFTAVASVLLTSAGVAFTSVLKGRFVELVSQLVSLIFPEIPGAAPK